MVKWCFVSDVVQAAWVLNNDFEDNGGTITSSEIEGIIGEATVITQGMMAPNYTVESIDAFGEDDIPIVVRNLTKIIAARILLQRHGLDSSERNVQLITMMNEQYDNNSRIIAKGLLRDNLGGLITPVTQATFSQAPFNDKFNEVLYPDDVSRTY